MLLHFELTLAIAIAAAAGDVQHVMELAAPALIAWMEARLRHQQPSAAAAAAAPQLPLKLARPAIEMAPEQSMQAVSWHQRNSRHVLGLQGFFDWVRKEQVAGEITFEVKQDAA
jgi:hypothetical protein